MILESIESGLVGTAVPAGAGVSIGRGDVDCRTVGGGSGIAWYVGGAIRSGGVRVVVAVIGSSVEFNRPQVERDADNCAQAGDDEH